MIYSYLIYSFSLAFPPFFLMSLEISGFIMFSICDLLQFPEISYFYVMCIMAQICCSPKKKKVCIAVAIVPSDFLG